MGRHLAPATQNPRTCCVCNHANRAEIEMAIFSIRPSNPALTLDVIADAYEVSSQELRVHALMHTPLALDFSSESETRLVENFQLKAGVNLENDQEGADATSRQPDTSCVSAHNRPILTDSVNLREGDMLLASANELLTTMNVLGRRIHRFASDNSDGADQRLVNFCTNAMVGLYTGTASELRKTIAAISDLNIAVNGEHDSAADGLTALAKAIAGSAQPKECDED